MNKEKELLWYLIKNPKRGGIAFPLKELLLGFDKSYGKNTYARLKKKAFLTYEADTMVVTEKGKQYLKRRAVRLPTFEATKSKERPDLIVMFDIPEDRKSEREWFRIHLKRFGYTMIQKSVWFGPSPLPQEFVAYLYSIGLENNIRTFHAREVEKLGK